MKLTKIIATIGPSSEDESKIKELILNGVDIFRFNFKHNTITWHDEKINLVHRVAEKLGRIVGILVDLQGPEIRLKLPKESLTVKLGDRFLLSEKEYLAKKGVSFSHPEIIEDLKEDDQVLVDDGKFDFLVKKEKGQLFLVANSEGKLLNSKSVTIPHLKANLPVLTKKDLEGLKLAQKTKIDYVALSFVRGKDDILTLRKELKKLGIEAMIIAKIETALAIRNLEEIIQVSDGVMVARGDLGVEEPLVKVGYFQKEIIRYSRDSLKPVITATQMLESMIQNPRPTRAEISDITNACYDGTDATMLSAETATGLYPQKAVFYMAQTLSFIEGKSDISYLPKIIKEKDDQELDVVFSGYHLYRRLVKKNKKKMAFLVFTQSGKTARVLSSFRPRCPIFAVIPDEQKARSLSLYYGITPIYDPKIKKGKVHHEAIDEKINILLKKGYLKKGLTLIILHGDIWGKLGGTSTIRLYKIYTSGV